MGVQEAPGATTDVHGWTKAPARLTIVWVTGTPVRYYHSTGRGLTPMPTTVDGVDLIDLPSVRRLGDLDSRIDDLGGVEVQGVQTIELLTRETSGVGWPDPGHVFGMLGVEAADVDRSDIGDPDPALRMRLTEAIGPTATTIKVDRDPADQLADPESPPSIIHIGVEAIQVSGYDGSSADPDDVDPYRWNVTKRGALGTTGITHRPTTATSSYPELTGRPTEWTGRRVHVHITGAYRRGVGLVQGEAVHLVNGYLITAPAVERPGIVSLEVLQVSGRLDQDAVLRRARTTLLDGFADFDGVHGSSLVATFRLPASAYSAQTSALSAAGSGELIAPYERHEALFDVLGFPAGHPRTGVLRVAGAEGVLLPTGYDDAMLGDPRFTLGDNQPLEDVEPDTDIHSATALETAVVPLDGVLQWPMDVLAEADAVWGSHPWLGLHWFVRDSETLSVAVEGGLGSVAGRAVWWADPHDQQRRPVQVHNQAPYEWPGNVGEPGAPFVDGVQMERRFRPFEELYYPFWFNADTRFAGERGADTDGVGFYRWISNGGRAATTFPGVITCPTAFYQRGQPSFLAPFDITPADAVDGSFGVVIHHYEPWVLGAESVGEEIPARRQWQTATIAEVEAAALPDGGTAYRYLLSEESARDLRSFGAWPGLPAPVITIAGAAERLTGSDLLEELLTDPDLLGLEPEDVNTTSLGRITDGLGRSHRYPTMSQPLMLRDVLRGVLAGNSVLVVKTDRNGARLTRGAIGRGVLSEIVFHLQEKQIKHAGYGARDGRIDGLVINSRFNDDGEAQLVQEFNHYPAQAAAGGDRRVETLDFFATHPDSPDDMIPVALTIFDNLRRDRRDAKLVTSIYMAAHLSPTSLLRVTHSRLRSRTQLGVSGAVFRVMDRVLRWADGVVELGLVLTDDPGAGWAPCMLVTGLFDADTVEVAEREYAPAEDYLGRSWTDLDYWREGEVVWCARNGDQDADAGGVPREARRVIQEIDHENLRVKLGPYDGGPGGHGFDARLGNIEPAEYALQLDHHRQYASLASTGDVIPDGGDGTSGYRVT